MEYVQEIYITTTLFFILSVIALFIAAKTKKLTVVELIWLFFYIMKVKKVIKEDIDILSITEVDIHRDIYRVKILSKKLDLSLEFHYSDGKVNVTHYVLPNEIQNIVSSDSEENFMSMAKMIAEVAVPYIATQRERISKRS